MRWQQNQGWMIKMKYKIIFETDEKDEVKFRTACNASLEYGLANAGVEATLLEIRKVDENE